MFHARKSLPVLICLIVFAMLITACVGKGNISGSTPAAEKASNQIVKDAMGHEVKIPANPQRVLAPYLEDHLTVLGVKPVAQWSIGQTVQDYLQPALKDVQKISWDLPPEAVAAVNPDLIIISSPASVQNGLYEKYSKIAPTYILGDELGKDWRQQLLKIGELLNKSDAAKKALNDYDYKAKEAKAKIHQVIGEKSAAIVWMVEKQFYLFEETRFSGKVMYGDLGVTRPKLVQNLAAPSAKWEPISLEKLSELDADHLFLVKKDGVGSGKEAFDSPVWKALPAVKQNHVYEIKDSGSWTNSGLAASEKTIDDIMKALGK